MREVLARSWVGVCLPLALSLSIYMIPLFNFGSIYSSNASGAVQMPETNNSNHSLLFKSNLT